MRSTLPTLLAALVLATGALASRAEAQVVIQGQVTYTQDPAYQQQQQPPTYQQQQPTYQQQGNYVQPGDPNAGYQTAYVQQPVGQPQPTRYLHRSAAIPAIFVPGLVLLIGGYVTQAIGAPMLTDAWDTSDQLGYAYIPILGPWLQLGTFSDLDRALENGVAHFSWITGVAQALGLVLTIVGLTVHEEWDEPIYALTDDPNGPSLSFDGTHATLTF